MENKQKAMIVPSFIINIVRIEGGYIGNLQDAPNITGFGKTREELMRDLENSVMSIIRLTAEKQSTITNKHSKKEEGGAQ